MTWLDLPGRTLGGGCEKSLEKEREKQGDQLESISG